MCTATNYQPLDALGLVGWEATPAECLAGRLVCEIRWGSAGFPTLIEAGDGFALFTKMRDHVAACECLYNAAV